MILCHKNVDVNLVDFSFQGIEAYRCISGSVDQLLQAPDKEKLEEKIPYGQLRLDEIGLKLKYSSRVYLFQRNI